jgi:MFS family permease
MAITTFRAFGSRNYRLYFSGQSVSLVGTWMQKTAVTWLIYSMTHSAFWLGFSVFAIQFPSFLLSLFGGVVSDRYDKYKVLLFTQCASLVQAVLLTILVWAGHYMVWEILTLSAVLGIINAFDVPARQSLVYDMVDDKANLSNAIALNSSMVNLARLAGPAISGIVLQKFGAAICFGANAASFVAVITSLLLMKLPPYQQIPTKKDALEALAEGYIYLKRTPTIGAVILLLACTSLLVLPYNTLLPIYAADIFHGNAATYGYITSFIGLGAVCGTIFLASLKPGSDLKIILLANTIIFGIGLMLFSHATSYVWSMSFAVVCGFGTMSQTTICNTIIQTTVNQRMRGRVISYFALAFFGMLPLGSLLIGIISEHIGAPHTILAEGIIAVIIALLFSPFLRKEYMAKRRAAAIEAADAEEQEVL